jgi:hypothetical protein
VILHVVLLGVLMGTLPVVQATPLALVSERSWYWTDDTEIHSVAVGDVDGDSQVEIVTGGNYDDGTRRRAQLCVWDGATLALENVQTWYWNDDTDIASVAVGDVDGDSQVEIVTGGGYDAGYHWEAQLCVWDGTTLALENVQTWYWNDDTDIASVAVGDVDGDADIEIVTGGYCYDGRDVAQLCVWDGATLALEDVTTWYWTSITYIRSVAVGNVDSDGAVEVVTGGRFYDGSRWVVQLCTWTGATLALEDVATWYWVGDTDLKSVAVGNVDADGQMEIVTGGYYFDGTRHIAQLCTWTGATLVLEDVVTWYWTDDTQILSVAVGNVDSDSAVEIVTGGCYDDGTHAFAQLCVWHGTTLALEDVETWRWGTDTYIYSVAVGNIDDDANMEVVTGGFYFDTYRYRAQFCVWL